MSKNIIRIYLFLRMGESLMHGLHSAIYVTYLLNNDLSLLEVNLVNACFMISVFIFEIPTGAIADLYGRKKSFFLSNIFNSLGFLVYGLGSGIFSFVLAEIIIAIAITLQSGAFKAWLVDSLHYYGWQGELIQVFRKEGRVIKFTALVGGLAGAYMGINNLAIPFIVGGIGFAILSILTHLLMKEEYFINVCNIDLKWFASMKSIIEDSVRYGIRHKVIFMIITIVTILAFGFQPLNMYWQPWFGDYLSGNHHLGFVWLGITGFAIIGNEMTNWITKRFTNNKLGYLLIGWGAAFFILLAAIMPPLWWSLFFFYVHEIFRGIYRPYNDAILQANIPSNKRATVDSFVSMMQTGAATLGLIIFGLVANEYGIAVSWIIAGLIIIVLFPLALLFNCKNKTP